ncbi:MAG: PAS domain-containing protein, partial [Bacteroidota bacterium]
MEYNSNKQESRELRKKAEALLRGNPLQPGPLTDGVEVFSLIRELLVHQLVLEQQNDDLRHLWAVSEVSNDRFTGLYDFTPMGYFRLSRQGEILELNASGASMLGTDRLQLKNHLFGPFVSAETLRIFNIFLGTVFDSRNKESCEVALSSDTGFPVYVHMTGIVSVNGDQCLVTLTDISPQKKASEELREREEKLRDITSSMTDWVWEVDEKGIYTYCSHKSNDLLGFGSEEIIGRCPLDFMP